MGAKLASLSGVTGATQDRGLSFITSTTFSAISSLSIDNCFTASYANYRVVVTAVGTAAAEVRLRLRVAGADNSTSNYYNGAVETGGNFAPTSAADNVRVGYVNAASSITGMALDLFSPALAAQKQQFGIIQRQDSSGAQSGRINIATAFDGFTEPP